MGIDFDDLLASYGEPSAPLASCEAKLLEACSRVAGGHEAGQALGDIREALSEGAAGLAKDGSGLRAVDVLARGHDSPEAAAAIEWLAEAGLAEAMLQAPTASEMPPMMAACYHGNAQIVEKFLELGMPADVRANAPKAKILNGTPFHATVLGYRESRKDDYAAVLRSLLTYCPRGIDLEDRMRQKPIDLAVKAAAATGVRTLADAMLQFGVDLSSGGQAGAEQMVKSLIKRTGAEELRVLMAANSAKRAIREIEDEMGQAPAARP